MCVTSCLCLPHQFFSILASIVFNKHPVNLIQWLAVFLVFSGLIGDGFHKADKGSPAEDVAGKHRRARLFVSIEAALLCAVILLWLVLPSEGETVATPSHVS